MTARSYTSADEALVRLSWDSSSNRKRVVEKGDWLRADIHRKCGANRGREVPVPFFHGARHSPSEKGDRHRRQSENSRKSRFVTEPVPIFGLPAYSLSSSHFGFEVGTMNRSDLDNVELENSLRCACDRVFTLVYWTRGPVRNLRSNLLEEFQVLCFASPLRLH